MSLGPDPYCCPESGLAVTFRTCTMLVLSLFCAYHFFYFPSQHVVKYAAICNSISWIKVSGCWAQSEKKRLLDSHKTLFSWIEYLLYSIKYYTSITRWDFKGKETGKTKISWRNMSPSWLPLTCFMRLVLCYLFNFLSTDFWILCSIN